MGQILVILLSIFILIRTISYGIYEIQKEHNKAGGIVVICLAILATIAANIMVWLR